MRSPRGFPCSSRSGPREDHEWPRIRTQGRKREGYGGGGGVSVEQIGRLFIFPCLPAVRHARKRSPCFDPFSPSLSPRRASYRDSRQIDRGPLMATISRNGIIKRISLEIRRALFELLSPSRMSQQKSRQRGKAERDRSPFHNRRIRNIERNFRGSKMEGRSASRRESPLRTITAAL